MVPFSLVALIVGALSIPCAFFALNGGAAFFSLALVLGGFVLGGWACCAIAKEAGWRWWASPVRWWD